MCDQNQFLPHMSSNGGILSLGRAAGPGWDVRNWQLPLRVYSVMYSVPVEKYMYEDLLCTLCGARTVQ
jgi:hypothetical protein